MPLVVVDTGKKPLLGYMLDGFNATNLTVHLYKNVAFLPDHTTVLGDMDECNFDTYTSRSLLSTWALLSTLDGTRRAVAQAQRLTWVLTGMPVTPNNVFGYYVTDSGLTTLYWAEAFSASQPMFANGDFISFKPTLTLRSEFDN